MKQVMIIYSTFPDVEAAQKVGKQLIEEKFLACAVYIPAQSDYSWNNEIQSENEYVMIGKTSRIKLQLAIQKLEALHPYDIPCILTWECACNETYAHWVGGQTS